MTEQQHPEAPPPAAGAGSATTDATMDAIAAVSLRLLAGAIPRKTMEALKRTVLASPAEYPWQVVNQVVLAEPVEANELAQKGLKAQRDWLLRGGREAPGKPLSVHAKTLVAKLLVQLIFLVIYTGVVVVMLLLLKHKWPSLDIYGLLRWAYEAFPSLVPK